MTCPRKGSMFKYLYDCPFNVWRRNHSLKKIICHVHWLSEVGCHVWRSYMTYLQLFKLSFIVLICCFTGSQEVRKPGARSQEGWILRLKMLYEMSFDCLKRNPVWGMLLRDMTWKQLSTVTVTHASLDGAWEHHWLFKSETRWVSFIGDALLSWWW